MDVLTWLLLIFVAAVVWKVYGNQIKIMHHLGITEDGKNEADTPDCQYMRKDTLCSHPDNESSKPDPVCNQKYCPFE